MGVFVERVVLHYDDGLNSGVSTPGYHPGSTFINSTILKIIEKRFLLLPAT